MLRAALTRAALICAALPRAVQHCLVRPRTLHCAALPRIVRAFNYHLIIGVSPEKVKHFAQLTRWKGLNFWCRVTSCCPPNTCPGAQLRPRCVRILRKVQWCQAGDWLVPARTPPLVSCRVPATYLGAQLRFRCGRIPRTKLHVWPQALNSEPSAKNRGVVRTRAI